MTYAITVDNCDCGREMAEDGPGEYVRTEAEAVAKFVELCHASVEGGRYWAIHCLELGAVHVVGAVVDGVHYPFPNLEHGRGDLASRRRRR